MGWILNTPGPSNSQKKERTTQIWYKHVPTNCTNKLYFLGAIIESWIYHKTAISLIGRLWSWKLGPQDWSLTLQVMSLFYVRWSFLTWYIIKSVWRFYGRKGVDHQLYKGLGSNVGCFITTNFATYKALWCLF
jgi:hypothetical protein